MRLIANSLVTTSLLTTSLMLVTAFAAMPARAADLDANSAIDTVTVYPDGASVTRIINADLASGDTTLVTKDFPLTLDPSSLRVEVEALKDERANLQGTIAAAQARRKFAERFAEASPAGIGDKGEARPIAEWRAAFAAVAEEIAAADSAIRDAERKQRELDREIARLEADRSAKPPARLEVRIDLAAAAATRATLRVTYSVRQARWAPLYDARLDTGAKDRKPALELVRRAEITQSTGEDWSNVALGVSTVRIARGGSAPELNSLIVQYPQVPRPLGVGTVSELARPAPALRSAQMAKAADALDQRDRADEQQAVAEVGDFQATFKIPGRVSVGASEGANTKSRKP